VIQKQKTLIKKSRLVRSINSGSQSSLSLAVERTRRMRRIVMKENYGLKRMRTVEIPTAKRLLISFLIMQSWDLSLASI
jgi:hypothetical protein